MAEQAPKQAPDSLLEYMMGYLCSSKCRVQGKGGSVKVEVQANAALLERMQAVAGGGLGRIDGRLWTVEGPAQVQALAAWIEGTLRKLTPSVTPWEVCPTSHVARKMRKAAAGGGGSSSSASAGTTSKAASPAEGAAAAAPAGPPK